NANAFTGKAGVEGARAVAMSAAGIAECRAQEVFIASTGVIGEPLPAERITRVLGSIAQDAAMTGWKAAAEAIMTTDTLPKVATGRGANHPLISKGTDKRLVEFRRKLDDLLLNLALQVVRDGEGARKLIRVDVSGAASDESARRIAMSVANSPLVKTA